MKTRVLSLLACAGLALSLTGCVTTGSSSGSSGGADDLRQQVARHDQQIQGLLSQVGQVENVLPGQAEVWSQMQLMRQELNQLQGGGAGGDAGRLAERVDRLEAMVRKMASQLAISTDSLDAPSAVPSTGIRPYTPPMATPPMAVVPPTPGATSGVALVNEAAETTAVESGPEQPGGAKGLYDSGIKAFDQKRFKDAVVAFKDFGTKYPKDKLAGNAFFWQGESYFQMKDYARAALAYQEIITKYPGNGKFQAAMLKQGIALHNVNKKDAARERLEELVKRYPNSPEATRAKQFLKENK